MADDDKQRTIDRVKYLEDSASMQAYRRRIPMYHQTVNGTLPPDYPEHLLKGQVIEMNSPRANRVKRQIKAERAAYPKYVTVTAQNPDGNVTQPLKDNADKVERWDTLAVDRLDSGKRVTNQVTDHQVASGWCVMLLHCGEDPEFPWRVEVPDPLTCFYPVQKGGPFRPKYLGRRFKMLVRDAQERYGTSKGKKLVNKGDKGKPQMRFEPLDYARPVDGAGLTSTQGYIGQEEDFAEEVTMIVLYTPDMTYHVCMDADDKDGEVVWQQKNITGGVPAIVVPGDTNESGGPGEENLPIMFEVLTVIRAKNLCRGLIMTVAAADRPEMVISCSPEQLAAMKERGMAVPANDMEVKAGGPRMLAINGEATNWVAAPNDALFKINEELTVEIEQAANALVPSTDTQLAAASTAEAWHSVTGTQNRQQTPMLQHLDHAWAEVVKMIHASIPEYDESYTLTAAADISRKHGSKSKQIKAGTSVTLNASDLDFDFTVTVATVQETEEQLQRRKESAWIDYGRGLISFEQVIAVANPDVDSQVEELMFDSAVSLLDFAALGVLATAYQGKLLTRAGIYQPMSAQMLMPASMQPQQAPMGGGGGMGGGAMQQPGGWQPAPEAAAAGGGTAF